jgi:4-aminobutyrate aminotransferase-like enzyme
LAALERFFERLFERPTARFFRTRLQPVQLQRRIERAMESERLAASDRTLVPNRYTVHLNPDDVAAFLVEPILGEGGYVVPDDGFLRALRALADQHGIMLIADEVQTGYGRTGRMFATEWTGARPDILVMAKGIASGMPLSGIMARRSLMDKFTPGVHGGTYGGNAVSCAAALATLDVMEDEGLVASPWLGPGAAGLALTGTFGDAR